MAGLVAARVAAAAGERVVVVDGGHGAAGGSVARGRLADLDVDLGAEGFATRGGAVVGLLTELGIADDVVRPEPSGGTRIVHAGRTLALPRAATLGIPTDLDAAEVAALGPAAHERVRRDATLPAAVGADATTLGALVRARMGDDVVDAFVAPLVAGVHRLDVDDVPVHVLLPGVLDRLAEKGSLAAALAGGSGGALAGLRGGMHRLVEALLADLRQRGVEVVTGPVTRVSREDGDGDADAGWRVRAAGADVVGERLLLACPPWDWPDGVPAAVATAGSAWPLPRDVDLVTMLLARDGGARRTGAVVASGAAVGARALTWSSAKWGWLAERAGERQVLRLTYDGRDATDAEMARAAVADVVAIAGGDLTSSDLLAADRTRWRMPRSAIEPGLAAHRDALTTALAEVSGLEATGGWRVGTGLAWVVDAAGRVAG